MHCRYFPNSLPQYEGMPPEVFLMPQTEFDQEELEQLLQECHVLGFGRHCDTNKILHVRIALERKEPHE